MNWGNSIIIAFVIFIGIVASMVVVSVKQDIPLVSKDYYSQEIRYQDEIIRIQNAKPIDKNIEIKSTKTTLMVLIKDMEVKEGKLMLYSPLGPQNDRKISFNKNQIQMNIEGCKRGKYTALLRWVDNENKEYQTSRIVYFP